MDELEERLRAVRDARGFLLPHHGLLAMAFPRLLEGYDAAYTAMALDDRVLSHHDREFVWLAVLAAVGEVVATHHVAKFRAAGGTDAGIAAAYAACAGALGAEAYDFAAADWAAALAPFDAKAAYLAGVRRLAPLRLAHLAQAAALTCRGRWRVLAWQIEGAYADGVPEDELAEALTLAMFPGSIPRFVRACGVWRDLIRAGSVPASDRYRTWAAIAQDGAPGARTGG
jgi:alkylhydroperoxidase/carboxymuconolactone decarboxylase family protein YurZ